MSLLLLLFWLIAGVTLQVAVPAWRHMGQPAFPFLLAVVLYVAVNKRRTRTFVATALLAGVLEDALSLAPLGFSACSFLAAGGLALLLREDFFADQARTVLWFGALCSAAATGAMGLLLRGAGLVALTGGALLRRMTGAAVLGAVLIPVLFALMRRMERLLGTWEDRG